MWKVGYWSESTPQPFVLAIGSAVTIARAKRSFSVAGVVNANIYYKRFEAREGYSLTGSWTFYTISGPIRDLWCHLALVTFTTPGKSVHEFETTEKVGHHAGCSLSSSEMNHLSLICLAHSVLLGIQQMSNR